MEIRDSPDWELFLFLPLPSVSSCPAATGDSVSPVGGRAMFGVCPTTEWAIMAATKGADVVAAAAGRAGALTKNEKEGGDTR